MHTGDSCSALKKQKTDALVPAHQPRDSEIAIFSVPQGRQIAKVENIDLGLLRTFNFNSAAMKEKGPIIQ